MNLTTRQLSECLQVPMYKARRWAKLLNLPVSKARLLTFHIAKDHPLNKSIKLARYTSIKPVYTITQLASIWKWRKGFYTQRRVRQRLNDLDVPIQNKTGLGLIYLVDLVPILKESITKWEIFELY